MATPIGAPCLVDSAASSAVRLLRSELGAKYARTVPTSELLMSASQRSLLLHDLLYALPLSRFRPAMDPTRYVRTLAEYFNLLTKADVSPEAYLVWANAASAVVGDADVEKAVLTPTDHQELASCYNALWAHKRSVGGALDADDAVHVAHQALRAARNEHPDLDVFETVWQQRIDAVVIDDAQDLTPAQARWFGALATARGHALVCGDWNASLESFRGASQDNLAYFSFVLPDATTLQLDSFPSPLPLLVEATNEAAVIAHWAKNQKDLVVAVRSRYDCIALERLLLLRGVRCRAWAASRGSLLSTEEARTVRSLLRAALAPEADCDRELLALSGSRLLPRYRSDLTVLRQGANRSHAAVRVLLSETAAGSLLLKHLAELGTLARRGTDLPTLVLEAFRLSGLDTLDDERSQTRLAQMVDLLVSTDASLAAASKTTTDASAVVARIDQLAALGGPLDAAESEDSTDDEDFGVRVITLHALVSGFDPGTVESLVIARCSDSKLPSSRRAASSFTPPRSLVGKPRPLDGLDETGPFLPPPQDREAHVESERRLLEQALGRASGPCLVTRSTRDKPSRFFAGREWSLALPNVVESFPLESGRKSENIKQDIDETTAEVVDISYSRMVEYETCPARFRGTRLVRVPATPALVLGSVLHSAAEHSCLGEDPALAFTRAWDDIFAQQPPPEGFFNRAHVDVVRQHGLNVVKNFAARPRANKILHVEQRFEFVWRGACVVGVVDLIEELPSGEQCLVDFKSGTADSAKLKRLAKDNVQLALYAWAHEISTGYLPRLVALESLETGQRVEVEPSRKVIESVQTRLFNAVEGIRANRFDPKPGNACAQCPLRKTCNASVSE